MTTEEQQTTAEIKDVVLRSRKENRRTLKGCITQAERIQQQIRNVGMQYATPKPEVFKALHGTHEVIDIIKKTLLKTAESL